MLIALVLLLFAGFQFNDQDAELWVVIYAIASLFFVLAFLGIYHRLVTLGALILSGTMALFRINSVWQFIRNKDGMSLADGMSYAHPYIEESREFGGILIIFLCLLWLFRANS